MRPLGLDGSVLPVLPICPFILGSMESTLTAVAKPDRRPPHTAIRVRYGQSVDVHPLSGGSGFWDVSEAMRIS